MIRKKWTGGEPVLSVETEDEFHKALPLGLPIEVSPEIAEGIGLMEVQALVHESELARNEPDSQVHHLPRAYDDGLPSSAIRLRM